MYTELIFGAKLKKETPEIVIEFLKYMMGEMMDRPTDFPLPDERCDNLFHGGSQYFPVNYPVSKMWFNDIDGQWHISTRSNIKNHHGQIEAFLEWIKPFIDGGSGVRGMYAIKIYEGDYEPTIYYLYEYDAD